MGRKIFILGIIFFLAGNAIAGPLKITFLDAGEGEATLLEINGMSALVDSGNIITGYSVAQFIKKRHIEKLDFVIITHPHYDQMSGVFHILQQIPAKARFDNGQPFPKKDEQDIYRWYSEFYRNSNYKVLKKGDTLIMDEVEILVLSPEYLKKDWNSNSLVLKITHKANSMLLMGDAGIMVEKELLQKNENMRANILKVGHHGADDTSSESFIKAVNPVYAIITINQNNIRGYPSQSVIKRLKEHHAKVLYTYKNGDIIFESDGKKMKRIN